MILYSTLTQSPKTVYVSVYRDLSLSVESRGRIYDETIHFHIYPFWRKGSCWMCRIASAHTNVVGLAGGCVIRQLSLKSKSVRSAKSCIVRSTHGRSWSSVKNCASVMHLEAVPGLIDAVNTAGARIKHDWFSGQ